MMRAVLQGLVVLALASGGLAGELPVKPGGKLAVDLSVGGSIEVRGSDRAMLVYELEGGDADRINLVVDRRGDEIRISADRHPGANRRQGLRLRLTVPRRFDLELHTTGGEIDIRGVEGRIEGETLGGDLVLSELRGNLRLTTMGGSIELADSEVDGSVRTYGGKVALSRIRGDIDADSLGGDVIFDDVRGSGREVKVSTMGGNIRVPDAPVGAKLETMGGHIEVERAQGHVIAKTMGGDIRIGEVDGWVKATTMGGDIDVTVTVGAAQERGISLITHGGNVTLRLPTGFSADIDATVTYTRKSRQDYRIVSDFPLKLRETPDWAYGTGDPRKNIHGTASVEGGAHRVKIEAINGDIRIVRTP